MGHSRLIGICTNFVEIYNERLLNSVGFQKKGGLKTSITVDALEGRLESGRESEPHSLRHLGESHIKRKTFGFVTQNSLFTHYSNLIGELGKSVSVDLGAALCQLQVSCVIEEAGILVGSRGSGRALVSSCGELFGVVIRWRLFWQQCDVGMIPTSIFLARILQK